MPKFSLLALFVASSCAHSLTFTSFGDADPAADRKITEGWQPGQTQPGDEAVRVLIDTIPEGITVEKEAIAVAPGSAHKLIGKFTVEDRWSGRASLESLILEARRAAASVGADLVIGSYISRYGDFAWGLAGVAIKTDPALGGAKNLKTTPVPAAPQPKPNSI